MSRRGYNYYRNRNALKVLLMCCGFFIVWKINVWITSVSVPSVSYLYYRFRVHIFSGLAMLICVYFLMRKYKRRSIRPYVFDRDVYEKSNEVPALYNRSNDAVSRFIKLEPIAFEKAVSNILQLYGYKIIELGELRRDGGIDLIAEIPPSTTPNAVQCKKYYREKIKKEDLEEFLKNYQREGYSRGIYITLLGFTEIATEFARLNKIDIWDAARLHDVLLENELRLNEGVKKLIESSLEYCPRCDSRMTMRRARRGKTAGTLFWSCTERECRTTKDF